MPSQPVNALVSKAVALAAFVLALAASRTVIAAEEASRLAISHVVFEGNLPPEARKLLRERLAEGLARADVQVVGGPRPAREEGCANPTCYRQLASKLGVAYLVAGRVEEKGKTYDIELELVTGPTGRSSGTHKQRCQICGLSEAGERMSLAASTLTEKLKSLLHEPGRVVVRVHPGSATVVVDGVVKGPAPQEVSLGAGRHKLELEKPGYRSVAREIEVVPAVDQELDLQMVAIPSAFPFKAAGYSAIGLGLASLAASVVAMTAFHGQNVACDNPDRDGDCPKAWEAAWHAVGFATAGAALTTVGGLWLYLGHKEPMSASASVSGVGWRGRF